jgi:hypothetical protein
LENLKQTRFDWILWKIYLLSKVSKYGFSSVTVPLAILGFLLRADTIMGMAVDVSTWSSPPGFAKAPKRQMLSERLTTVVVVD